MTKTTIIPIIIIVTAGLGLFIVNNSSNNSDSEVLMNSSEEVSELSSGKKMSFAEFLRQDKGAYECTVTQYIDEGMSQTTQGLVYLYNGLVRGDFEIQVSGMNILSSTIVKDGFSYTWSSMSPVGFKAKANMVTEDVIDSKQASGTYSWNSDQIGEYDCKEWNVDTAKFELPSNVSFQEI